MPAHESTCQNAAGEVVRRTSFNADLARTALDMARNASTVADLKKARATADSAGVWVGNGTRGTVAERIAKLTTRITKALGA